MGRQEILEEARKLSAEDRILLAHDLWSSAEQEDFILSAEQDAELMRRVEEYKSNPDNVIAWEEVVKKLSEKKK